MEKCYANFQTLKVALGEHTMGRTQVFEWFSKFKSAMTSAEVADSLECPLVSKQTKTWRE
jgi:hypothetical protein